MAFSPAAVLSRSRAGRALSRPHNWVQLAKFSAVGATGYAINLVVYTILLKEAGFHYAVAESRRPPVSAPTGIFWDTMGPYGRQSTDAHARRFTPRAVIAVINGR